jgi:predicted acetyltransferase
VSPAYDRFREEDGDAHLRLMRLAFGQAPAGASPFWRRAGTDAVRVMRDPGGAVAATATLLRWEHVLGGRPVPSVGVSAVAVDPGRRGGGIGTAMMRDALAEMRSAGAALASLYAATAPIYMRLGFGRAASHTQWSIPAADCAGVRTGARAEAADPADPSVRAALEENHRARALAGWSGPALRDGFLWGRALSPADGPSDVYLLRRADGTTAGHAAVARRALGARPAVQVLADACALDAEGAAAVFALAATLRSTVDAVAWTGGADEPLAMLAPEARVRIDRHEDLYLRVLDLPAALAARGWPPGLRERLTLAAEDGLFPENAGPWRLTVEDGTGAVEPAPGAQPDLTVAAGGAGPLVTGRASPHRLASLGLLRGTGSGLDAASRLFAGPAPWMPDFF